MDLFLKENKDKADANSDGGYFTSQAAGLFTREFYKIKKMEMDGEIYYSVVYVRRIYC